MAEQERPEPTFYWASGYPRKLEPGVSLEVKHSIEFNARYVDKCDLAELSKLSLMELQDRRKESVASEKALFEKALAIVQNWETQASRTMLLSRAIEYVKTPEVKHTSNEWRQQKTGFWEISNRVYVMRYQITQETAGNRKGQWLAAWGIAINKPKRPDTEKYYHPGDVMVVEVKKKFYNAEADAKHYIQGRFDAYTYLFKELSPPIPNNYKRHFTINGILLPGYTVAPPERSPQEVADALLDGLDDDELFGLLPQSEEPQEKAAGTGKAEEQPKPTTLTNSGSHKTDRQSKKKPMTRER